MWPRIVFVNIITEICFVHESWHGIFFLHQCDHRQLLLQHVAKEFFFLSQFGHYSFHRECDHWMFLVHECDHGQFLLQNVAKEYFLQIWPLLFPPRMWPLTVSRAWIWPRTFFVAECDQGVFFTNMATTLSTTNVTTDCFSCMNVTTDIFCCRMWPRNIFYKCGHYSFHHECDHWMFLVHECDHEQFLLQNVAKEYFLQMWPLLFPPRMWPLTVSRAWIWPRTFFVAECGQGVFFTNVATTLSTTKVTTECFLFMNVTTNNFCCRMWPKSSPPLPQMWLLLFPLQMWPLTVYRSWMWPRTIFVVECGHGLFFFH